MNYLQHSSNNRSPYSSNTKLNLPNSENADFTGRLRPSSSTSDLITMLESQVIGSRAVHHGPFGPRRLIYVDHTASGKPLQCIEEFIGSDVLPFYANTHTESSYTARQTGSYRNEARQLIKEAVEGNDDDVVIFYGSGTTACVHKLVHAVFAVPEPGQTALSPIVFVGPFEHHSNLLPWREAGAEVIIVPVNEYGLLDMKYLKSKLSTISTIKENHGRLLLGCFSAGSNVTGALNDDVSLTLLMHEYGGYAFFDYAAAAPHVKISMNPQIRDRKLLSLAKKDAIYFSGHKFIGGPQTTGVLVAKAHVFKNLVPHGAGGGTVFFVTSDKHAYLRDIAEREEGGTPAIIASIRLGLVFKLKAAIGEDLIISREAFFTRRALDRWSVVPNVIVLGNTASPRLPIVSFLIEHTQSGYYLHYNFVVSLLNDLFGIQSRGGCMCAGPYSQILLGVSPELAQKYEDVLSKPRNQIEMDDEAEQNYDLVFRLGFTRVSFPYHATLEEIDFIIDSVIFVAKHGWKLLPFYSLDPTDGTFTHWAPIRKANSMSSLSFTINGLELNENPKETTKDEESIPDFRTCLQLAMDRVQNTQGNALSDQSVEFSPESEPLRWFLLPSEAFTFANQPDTEMRSYRPFSVRKNEYDVQDIWKIYSRMYEPSIPTQIRNSWSMNLKRSAAKEIGNEDFETEGNIQDFPADQYEPDAEFEYPESVNMSSGDSGVDEPIYYKLLQDKKRLRMVLKLQNVNQPSNSGTFSAPENQEEVSREKFFNGNNAEHDMVPALVMSDSEQIGAMLGPGPNSKCVSNVCSSCEEHE